MAAAGPGKKLCGASTPRGKTPTCENVAGKGTDHLGWGHCSRHTGNTENGIKAAHNEMVLAEANRQLRAEGYEPNVDPVRELMSLGSEVTALKDILRSRVADLTDEDWVTRSKLGVEDVRAIVSAYERALDRCERTLTNMMKLDLEQRRLALDEADARRIEAAQATAFDTVGLTDHFEEYRNAFIAALAAGPQPPHLGTASAA